MEIITDINLTLEESTSLDLHSILNLLNVATLSLLRIQELLGDDSDLADCIEKSTDAAHLLHDSTQGYALVANVSILVDDIQSLVDHYARTHDLENDPRFIEHRQNLRGLYEILLVRAAEIQSRLADPLGWVRHEVAALQHNFAEVLRAIERNSHGAYRIVSNIAEQSPGDYFVHFAISSVLHDHLFMPVIFQDVMRDLLANARKYTRPGGRILAGLNFAQDELTFVVSDNGVGMHPDEIPDLVRFGKRGSNVQDRPTRGGGFGLTKAYYVARCFGGRLWIDSEGIPGRGCEIRITLPIPNDLP